MGALGAGDGGDDVAGEGLAEGVVAGLAFEGGSGEHCVALADMGRGPGDGLVGDAHPGAGAGAGLGLGEKGATHVFREAEGMGPLAPCGGNWRWSTASLGARVSSATTAFSAAAALARDCPRASSAASIWRERLAKAACTSGATASSSNSPFSLIGISTEPLWRYSSLHGAKRHERYTSNAAKAEGTWPRAMV